MIESRSPHLVVNDELTGGALWRRQSLRVMRAAEQISAPQETEPPVFAPLASAAHDPARIRRDRTFAQHGLLGAPHTLVVTVAVESSGVGRGGVSDIDVTFDLPAAFLAGDDAPPAGWCEPAEGWSFAVTALGGHATIALKHPRLVARGAIAEAAFQLVLAPHADLSGGLALRASGRAHGVGQGRWSNELTIPVDRLAL